MKPPGKTTLARMQRAASIEAERIEISQDGRVREKMLDEPMPEQVERRDDFAGIVRLIDILMSDQDLVERLQKRMAARASAAMPPAPAAVVDSSGDVAIVEEPEAP
jgi:hypothetical protein